MSNCTPCPPCESDLPLTWEPYGTVSVGNRVVVEDDAFCTKTLTNPASKSWLIWDNGIKWEEYAALYLEKSGGTMTGALILNADPSVALGAATKQYVDAGDALKVNKAGDTMTGALVVNSTISSNSTILATGNSSKIGYNTGAGGATTQGAGAKTNSVTLNRPTGIIVTDNASLAADTSVTFNLSNSVIESEDIVLVSHIAGGTLGSYNFAVAPAAGNANITIRNITAGALAEAITLRFIVVKSVNA